MRIRSIKPEFWKSDDVAALADWGHRLLFIGLWSYVDDNGVGRDNEKLIGAELFPLEDDPTEALARIRRGLDELSRGGLITRYEDSEGRRFVHITNWHHQKIDKPTRSSYPLPTSGNVRVVESSPNPPRVVVEDSAPGSRDLGIKGSRDQGIEGSNARGPKPPRATRLPEDWQPSLDLIEYVRTACPAVNGRAETENFVDYWHAKSGKDATKVDWPATYRRWMRTAQERTPNIAANGQRSSRHDENAEAVRRMEAREQAMRDAARPTPIGIAR